MNVRPPWLSADDWRGGHAGSSSAPERDPYVCAGQPGREKAGDKGVTRAGGVDHLDLRRLAAKASRAFGEKSRDTGVARAADVDRLGPGRLDTPAAPAFYRFCAGRAALDDDDRI